MSDHQTPLDPSDITLVESLGGFTLPTVVDVPPLADVWPDGLTMRLTETGDDPQRPHYCGTVPDRAVPNLADALTGSLRHDAYEGYASLYVTVSPAYDGDGNVLRGFDVTVADDAMRENLCDANERGFAPKGAKHYGLWQTRLVPLSEDSEGMALDVGNAVRDVAFFHGLTMAYEKVRERERERQRSEREHEELLNSLIQ